MSFPTFHNIFSGTSQGEFDVLKVRDANGQMVDVLTLGGGSITSVLAPLILSGSQLSIDLSLYALSADVAQALQSYVTQALLQTTLSSYRTIASSFSQINVGAPLTLASSSSATGTVVTIDTLFKPSSVSVGASSGLFAVANDQTGVLALSCNGSENRSQVRLIDANSVVRLITARPPLEWQCDCDGEPAGCISTDNDI